MNDVTPNKTERLLPITPEEALCACTQEEKEVLQTILNSEEPGTRSAYLFTQHRLQKAITLGVASKDPRANIIIVGMNNQEGYGVARDLIEKELHDSPSSREGVPDDWCYAFNTVNPRMPLAIPLPAGRAKKFKQRIAALRESLKKAIPLRLGQDDILIEKQKLGKALHDWLVQQQKNFAQEGKKYPDVSIVGEPLTPIGVQINQSDVCTDAEAFLEHSNALQVLLNKVVRTSHKKVSKSEEEGRVIERDAAKEVIEEIYGELDENTEGTLSQFFHGLKEYTIYNYEIFLNQPEEEKETKQWGRENNPFLPWEINVFIDRTAETGVPVIEGGSASINRFFGGIEYFPREGGGIYTDHTKIYAGDIVKANGGFLIINADEMLQHAGLWYVLKRTLLTQSLSFEPLVAIGAIPGLQMNPDAIDVSLRVVMFGSHYACSLFEQHDPDFLRLFSIRAEITPYLERSSEGLAAIGMFLLREKERSGLLPLSSSAAGILAEVSSRMAEDQNRFLTTLEPIAKIYREANVLAEKENATRVTRNHIRSAIAEQKERASTITDMLHDKIREGSLIIAVEGSVVGQVNALMVQNYAGRSFGLPGRINAVASIGKMNIANIHRNVGLAGPIFQKADETIQGFLKHRFAQTEPLCTEICFSMEQTYSAVEGDSASLAELFVVLSALSGIPIRQEIAITGSMSLRGEIQPIGGVNEKIEGFFDICRIFGAKNGRHGVIIPHQNKSGLMLKPDVIDALREKKFSVWPIRTLEEGVRVLFDTGAEAVFSATQKRLSAFAQSAQKFYSRE